MRQPTGTDRCLSRGGTAGAIAGLPVVADGGVCGARRVGLAGPTRTRGRSRTPSSRCRRVRTRVEREGGQKAKTVRPFVLPAISQALPYVVLNRTGLPCQTPSAVTTIGSH